MYGYIYKTTIRNPESELNWCFYIGQTPFEIAKEYGMRKHTIKNTIKRIEKRMKNE